jgi:hypothetical protein
VHEYDSQQSFLSYDTISTCYTISTKILFWSNRCFSFQTQRHARRTFKPNRNYPPEWNLQKLLKNLTTSIPTITTSLTNSPVTSTIPPQIVSYQEGVKVPLIPNVLNKQTSFQQQQLSQLPIKILSFLKQIWILSIHSIDADIQYVIQENDEVVLTKSLNQEGEKFSSTNNTNLNNTKIAV